MPRYRVLPYRQGSRSARALADALPGGRVLRLQGSTFRPRTREETVIINWGATEYGPLRHMHAPEGAVVRTLNGPAHIRNASNKLNFFNLMSRENSDIIPRFWTNSEDIPDDTFPIVCRTVLAGHSGDGIVIANTRGDLVRAPLYVEYKKKKDEYRVHCGIQEGQSIIIAVQRKARRAGEENVNWQVRNHSNGFVFVRGDVNPPRSVTETACRALQATGLDFGGVDVIYNEREGRAYVLEINTACGLEGQTVEDYANFFQGFIND